MFADMPLDNRTVDKFRGHRRENLAVSLVARSTGTI
jgi:hypothetical protein